MKKVKVVTMDLLTGNDWYIVPFIFMVIVLIVKC